MLRVPSCLDTGKAHFEVGDCRLPGTIIMRKRDAGDGLEGRLETYSVHCGIVIRLELSTFLCAGPCVKSHWLQRSSSVWPNKT